MMDKYIALHTLKTSAEEFVKAFTEMAPGFAKAIASGQAPAKGKEV
jgi:hypothetical protein